MTTPGIDAMAAMRGFFMIMDAWHASVEESRSILGVPSESTFYSWRNGNGEPVPQDTLRRIGYVASIYKALQIVCSDPHVAGAWVSRPNLAFGGQTPMQRMSTGNMADLEAVRSYLQREPWN